MEMIVSQPSTNSQANQFIGYNLARGYFPEMQSSTLARIPGVKFSKENVESHLQSRSYSTLGTGENTHERISNSRFEKADACEIISLVIVGGPKWGFRIKQLNDNRVVVSRLDKGAAEKCGLKVNDEILSVNNVPLGDKPRSLLLQDPNNSNSVHVSGETKPQAIASADSNQLTSSVDKSEASPLEIGQVAFMGPLCAGPPLELAKIDFAYQLIKHSSISNKLLLTVKRYLNPAYARASVAAVNLMRRRQEPLAQAQTFTSTLNTRRSIYDQGLANQENLAPSNKRPHTALGTHHAYKCCECYCYTEGKSKYKL